MAGQSQTSGRRQKLMSRLQAALPAWQWLRNYNRDAASADLVAAVIVAIMLIPQSLAYAMLAGLPPQLGLYASILPLVVYALFGTSTTLSVGPVAVTSLLTAAALSKIAASGSADYLSGAIMLALLSGVMLLVAGLLKLGFLANFLSHAVVSAFISGSAILIALSQLRHLLGIETEGETVLSMVRSTLGELAHWQGQTLFVAALVLLILVFMKRYGKACFRRVGVSEKQAGLLNRTAPVLAVIASMLMVYFLRWDLAGVEIVGEIPRGLPAPRWPSLSLELMQQLLVPAGLISMIGYVESISVGRTLGAKRRQKVSGNQELIGLGAANLASGFSGAFPVTGGFSRSVVNFDAGAVTQAASIYTAILIALVAMLLTPALYFLPKATLAATIIVAVLSLIDWSIFGKTWRFSKSDWLAVVITFVLTLLYGVEVGVGSGVLISLALHLYRTSQPHIAEVGNVPGTEHFRNVQRFKVETVPEVLSLRLDESLFFANANCLEELVYDKVFKDDRIAHVVLMFNAINEVDYSALEVLEELNSRLYDQGILLHISEIKGPVYDRLSKASFLDRLSGTVYLTQHQAISDLCDRFAYQSKHPEDRNKRGRW